MSLTSSPAHHKILNDLKMELPNLRNKYDDHEKAGELN